MTKEATLPNSNQTPLNLIAWVHEPSSELGYKLKKEAIPITLLTDKEVEIDGILGIEETVQSSPNQSRVIIRSDEYESVKERIMVLLEASIVNTNQLKALKSMVVDEFAQKAVELWGRIKTDD